MSITSPSEMKAIVNDAGLRAEEFASLCGVTRVTAHNWFKDGSINPLRRPRVEKVLAAIKAAYADMDLPIERPKQRGGDKEAMMIEIKAIVIKHARILANAD